MFTLAFIRATAERGVKTFAQSLGAVLAANGLGLISTDWVATLSTAGMAALLSILTSIGSDQLTGTGPSLTNAEHLPGHVTDMDDPA